MPPQIPKIDEKKIPFGGMGVGVLTQSTKIGDQEIGAQTPQNPKTPFNLSHHYEPKSLRSSFDYADVDLNNAMKVSGKPALTGRGQKFGAVKHFKEDKWSDDESVY